LNMEPVCIDPNLVIPICERNNLLNAYIFVLTNSTK